MKKVLLTVLCVGLASAMNVKATEKAINPSLAIFSDSKASVNDKVTAIDAYVRSVEENVSSYTRKEEKLAPDELKKVTDENWTKIHTYSDGTALKRMKMYPPEGSQKTEEFYYHDGKPVFVFLEDNGAGKENHDVNAVGAKFYFAHGKLIAGMAADGKAMDVKDAEAKKMAEKLEKESTAFRAAVK